MCVWGWGGMGSTLLINKKKKDPNTPSSSQDGHVGGLLKYIGKKRSFPTKIFIIFLQSILLH